MAKRYAFLLISFLIWSLNGALAQPCTGAGGTNVSPALMSPALPTANCGTCPQTYTGNFTSAWNIPMRMCAGNLYTISLCTSTPVSDLSVSVTQGPPGYIPVAGNFGSTFANDGCANGMATMQFSPGNDNIFYIRIRQDPCLTTPAPSGTLTITCAVPAAPANDNPCTPTVLPMGTECTFQVASSAWSTGVQQLGGFDPSCALPSAGYAGDDVWFQVTVPPSGDLAINTSLVGAGSIGLAVYQPAGGCGAVTPWPELACSNASPPELELMDPIAASPLTPGPAWIRVWHNTNIANMGSFQICAFEPIPPLNDNPSTCGAIALPATATCIPNQFQTENATPALITPATITPATPSCDATGPYNDVWFTTVVPPSGQMTVTTFAGTLTDMSMAWYRLSPGGTLCNPPGFSGTLTEIGCNDNYFANPMPRINSQVPAAIPLTPGETIYIRVWANGANQEGTFEICVTENLPPPNDNPCGAIPLGLSQTCNYVPTTNLFATTTTGVPAPGCGTGAGQNDVWYSTTVPPNGQVRVTTQSLGAGQLTDTGVAVYTVASGSCATSNLALVLAPPVNCQGGAGMSDFVFGGLPPGGTVYIRIWRENGSATNGDFNICLRSTAAVQLVGCDVTSYDSGGPTGNYGNNEIFEQTFCPENPGDVVSLSFAFFNTQQTFDVLTVYNGNSIGAPILGQFSGSSIPPGLVSSATNGCLTIRFTSNGSVTGQGWQFGTSCGPPLPPQPPAYGTCNTSMAGQTGFCCNTSFFDTGGANGNYGNNELQTWTFCSPTPGEVVTLTFANFNVENGWDFLTVFNGPNITSPSLGTFTGTINPGTFTSTDPSGCLTIRFTSDGIITSSGWTATVRCGAPQPPPPPPPPPTGICGTLVYDPGGPTGNYSVSTNDNGVVPPGAGSWFQTYCPEVPGDVVSLTFLTFGTEFGFDNVYIYNGTTVSPFNANGTQIFGNNPNIPTCDALGCNTTLGPGGFTGTTLPGTVTATITAQNPNGCLTISMTSDEIITNIGWSALVGCQSTAVGGDCTYMLRLYDTFGDGWAGSSVTVTVNGGTPSSYTLQNGYFNEIPISVDNGDNVVITYSGAGLFPTDNYWTLDLFGEEYAEFHSAIPAVNNVGYSFTADCQPPPAALTDCIGSQEICASSGPPVQNQLPGQTNFGSVGDLYSLNYGCLAGVERRGTWSVFGPQTAGSIGFQIVPNTVGENLDFAIWGPFPPGTGLADICAPTSPPIRCSIAAFGTSQPLGTGQTGIGSVTYSAPQYAAATPAINQGTGGNGWLPGINVGTVGEVYLLYVSNGSTSGGAAINWTGTAAMDCQILPIELLAFDAFAREVHVDVEWSTVSEYNSSHFDVQRSSDARNFTTIGSVDAAGYSQGHIAYRFVDGSPMEGLSYYRLMMMDQDGSGMPSDVVPVIFRRAAGSMEVFPNPATAELYVLYTAAQEEGVNWRLLDASGRLVMTGNRGMEKGLNRMELDVERLEMGSYLLELRGSDDAPLGTARFVKQ